MSAIDPDVVPRDLKEAVDIIVSGLSDEDRDFLETASTTSIHHHAGRFLRNNWSLWDKKSHLVQWFRAHVGVGHADDISAIILVAVQARIIEIEFDPARGCSVRCPIGLPASSPRNARRRSTSLRCSGRWRCSLSPWRMNFTAAMSHHGRRCAVDEKTVREAVARWLRTMPPHAKLDGDFCISKLTAAVMALRPKVDREQVLEWFKGAIGGEEFGMWFPNVEADLEAAGIEVVDE